MEQLHRPPIANQWLVQWGIAVMLKLEEHTRPQNLLPLARWLRQTLALPQVRLKLRVRGNNLHLLCEGNPCPDVATVTAKLIQGFTQTPLANLVPPGYPPIYQVLLYGRTIGSQRPAWTELIYLNQLDRYLEHLEALADRSAVGADDPPPHLPPAHGDALALVSAPAPPLAPPVTSTAIVVSNQSLARQGDPEAIARYLSETLSLLGVSVLPKVRTIRVAATDTTHHAQGIFLHPDRTQRLCIYCESSYRVDPAVVADPIATQLRGLGLSGYRDALVFSQVRGEGQAEWVLRVDLTPPEEMLREWARWGDLAALTQIVTQALGRAVQVSILQQETTLYLFCKQFCQPGDDPGSGATGIAPIASPAPDQAVTKAILAPLLTELAPQGAKAAAIYGLAANTTLPAAGSEPTLTTIPAWVDWLDLPGSDHEALAVPTRTLAEQGDLLAIVVLLTRQLNPNLEQQLATGGIRVQVLRKGDLIHVMTDAPRCPRQSQVGQSIAQFIRQLRLGGISGVRVYGRRAGQKRPRWCYGVDFVPRNRLVPEAMPEFAASDAYVGDLLASTGDLSLDAAATGLFSDLDTGPKLGTVITQIRQTLRQRLQQTLIQWQLCVPRDAPQPLALAPRQSLAVAIVWGALGLVLTVQADWLLARALNAQNPVASTASPALRVGSAAITDSPDTPTLPTAAPNSPTPIEAVPLPTATTSPTAGLPSSPSAVSDATPEEFPEGTGMGAAPAPDLSAGLSLNPASADRDDAAFNADGFTRQEPETTLETIADPWAKPMAEPGEQSAFREATRSGQPPASDLQDTLKATAVIAAAPTDYPSFSAQQLDQKLALYRHHLQTTGLPDVMIIGSSRALRGVDPTQLQQALQQPEQPPLRVFNFGVNGATAQVVDLIVRQLLRPEELPPLIIWADGARAFNSGRVDITYNAIAVSDGYRQLQAGILPPLTAPSTPTIAAELGVPSPLPPLSLADSYQQANQWLSDRLARLSMIYRDRYQLKNWLGQHLNTIATAVSPSPSDAAASLPGQPPPSAEGAAMDAFVKQSKVDINGFLPLSVQFNPATYYQQYARVSGTYDSDYANFTLVGQQHEALQNLLGWTRQHGVEVVFVNLPLTDTYLDPVRMDYEREFQAYLAQQALTSGLLVRDWSQIWLQEYPYFSDPSHLNRYGAYAISQRLAQDPRIAWPHANRKAPF